MVTRRIAAFCIAATCFLIFSSSAIAAVTVANEKKPVDPLLDAQGYTVEDGVVVPKNHRNPDDFSKQRSYVPGELIVKLKPGRSRSEISGITSKHGAATTQSAYEKQKHPRMRDVYNVKAGKEINIMKMAAELRDNPAVEYAEPNYIYQTLLVPNDPLYPQQWSHQRTQAESGWDIGTGDPNVVIAIIDTGVAHSHPDLSSNIWRDGNGSPGRDFVDIDVNEYIAEGYTLIPQEDYQGIDNEPADYYGHGTHVAGIAAGAGNNGIGITGVCPNCKIMPVRAGFALRAGSNTVGALENDDIANAIYYAADNGAKIINMSFGSYNNSQLIQDAVNYADFKGVVMVAAAGNNGGPVLSYPAGYDNVIAVAATSINDAKASYSNYGAWVDVAAPGGDGVDMIISTVPFTGHLGDPSGYTSIRGTSMASPYVAGLAGLILSRHPAITSLDVKLAIQRGSDAFGYVLPDPGVPIGTGRVNVYKTLLIDSYPLPFGEITSPGDDFILGGSTIDIYGTATTSYRVMYGQGISPAAWIEIGSGPASTGLLATLDVDRLTAPFDDYVIRLIASNENGSVEDSVPGQIGKQFLPGWPLQYSLGGPLPIENSPNLADIDNDGFAEIIIPGEDAFHQNTMNVFRKNGTPVEGWPVNLNWGTTFFICGTTIGDLDRDGYPDIIAPLIDGIDERVFAWDKTGSLLWAKAPDHSNMNMNVAMDDINGDGFEEIIIQSHYSKLSALNHTGNVLWSYLTNDYGSSDRCSTAGIADFNQDEKKEIVKNVRHPGLWNPGDLYATIGGSVFMFNHDGSVRWKKDWPEITEPQTAKYTQVYPVSSPIIADINRDGSPEILVKVSVWKGGDSGTLETGTRFYALDSNGNTLPGWPVSVNSLPGRTEMAVADVDLDGYLEWVGASQTHVYAMLHSGSFLFTPLEVQVTSNPSIGDVTGDERPDILVADGNSFRVIESNGSWSMLPIRMNSFGSWFQPNSPILADLDKNGTEDLVFFESASSRAVLWAWNLQVPHNANAEQWNMFAGNAQHTGLFPEVNRISSTPSSLNFGNVVPFRAKVLSTTITNTGPAELLISDITTVGQDSSMFRITNWTGPKTIPAGGSTVVNVVFRPTSKGAKTATLRIRPFDIRTQVMNMPLTGSGR